MFLPAPPATGQPDLRETKDYFVIAPPSSSTLREIRAHLTSPAALAVQGGVALLLGLSGPFDTFDAMRPGPRFAYWAIVVFATYAIGFTLSELANDWLGDRAAPRWLRVVLTGVAAGLGVGLVLGVINRLSLDNPNFPNGWLQTFGLAIVIAIVVVALHDMLHRPAPTPTDIQADTKSPPLLARLPLDKRGALVSLSVSDHYVDVVTTKGREMILMRLGDAMRETAPVRGMQVHRSHWVALDQVGSVRKTGETALLRTSTGGDIPVSRTYMKALRDNGLLPGRADAGNANG